MSGRYSEVHKAENLKGPGDARPTALQIIKDNDREGTMTDKVVPPMVTLQITLTCISRFF